MRFRILLLLFWVIACSSDDKPKDLIAQDKMVNILADIHVLESEVNDMHFGNSDSSLFVYQKLKVKMLKKYSLDTANFNMSFRYYISNPIVLKDIYAEVKKQLEERKRKAVKITEAQYSRKGKPDTIRKDSARHKLP